METRELMRLIAARLDPDELVDILGLETDALCLLLRQQIIEHKDSFEFLEIYETGNYNGENE